MTLDRLAWFVGEIARPLSIFIAVCGATASGVIVALKVTNGTDGALLLAAIWAGAGGLFLAKGIEVWKGSKDAASVEIAKAQSPNP